MFTVAYAHGHHYGFMIMKLITVIQVLTATVCDIKVSHIALVFIKSASVSKRRKRTKEERYGSASRSPAHREQHTYMQLVHADKVASHHRKRSPKASISYLQNNQYGRISGRT